MRSPLRGTGEMWRDHQMSADSVDMVDVNNVKKRAASCGCATLLGWCCSPPAEELSCQRKLLLLADWIRVPTCSWSRKKNIIELLDIALCVRCCTGAASAARRRASVQLRPPRPSQENPAESDYRTPCACCGSASKTAKTRKKL